MGKRFRGFLALMIVMALFLPAFLVANHFAGFGLAFLLNVFVIAPASVLVAHKITGYDIQAAMGFPRD